LSFPIQAYILFADNSRGKERRSSQLLNYTESEASIGNFAMMNSERSPSELLHRIAELEAQLAHYETGETELALAREVAGRKRAEQARRESEERLRLFIDNIPASIAMFDREMRYVAVSHRWSVEYLGGAESVLGRSHYEVFPKCPERWMAAHRRALAGEIVRVEEDMWRLADGSELWMRYEVRPWRAACGDVGGIIIFTENITQRKLAEAALCEREQQLVSIYNTVRDVIFHLVVEPEGQFRFVSVNAAFLRVTGLSLEAVVGKTVNDVIPEPSLTMVLEKYREAVKHKAIVSWEEISEYPTRRLTGEVTVAPVFDNQGACTHLVGSVHDVTERKHAESALRESEERFRTVADSAPVMIWMAGLDRLCNFFNKPWLKFTGRTIEQELGNGWADGVHPDDLERCLATYVSSFDDRRSFRMEYRLRCAGGEYRWILDNGTPLYREGEFTGYIGSCVDVTEQKLAEEQLRSNQAQLMDSQRLAKVGSWELDLGTRRTRWSDEWYRIFGLPKDVPPEFQTFLSCVHPKDREVVVEAENRSRSTSRPVVIEFRIIRPDGEIRFVRSIIEAVKDENGIVVRLAGANQDITEQVHATERLRESEARLKSAERMTHVGNWTWDIKSNGVSWSEEIFRITGQSQDYRPGYEESLQIIAPGDRDRMERWVRDCLAEKNGNLIEVRIVRPSGEMRTVVCTAEVLLDEDGSPGRMFGACQDVTDARRVQEESFARQKLESLGTLASGIAHDFNNLLGAILAQTELMGVPLVCGFIRKPFKIADLTERLVLVRQNGSRA
jgi:PAS domain S-box-containing protein